MTRQADIAVYSPDGKLALIVEVKNNLGTNSEWASRVRYNMLAHGLLPGAPFFLLALPDRFYLWKDNQLPEMIKPAYEIDPLPFLNPYYERTGIHPKNLSKAGFELLMTFWLNELTLADEILETFNGAETWLVESGLLGVIKNGRIAVEATI